MLKNDLKTINPINLKMGEVNKFYCKCCDLQCADKYKYDRHLKTKKHLRFGKPKMYECKICNYITKQKNDWNNHLLTIKHITNEVYESRLPSRSEWIVLNNKRKDMFKQYRSEFRIANDLFDSVWKKDGYGIKFGVSDEEENTLVKAEAIEKRAILLEEKYDDYMHHKYYPLIERIADTLFNPIKIKD